MNKNHPQIISPTYNEVLYRYLIYFNDKTIKYHPSMRIFQHYNELFFELLRVLHILIKTQNLNSKNPNSQFSCDLYENSLRKLGKRY